MRSLCVVPTKIHELKTTVRYLKLAKDKGYIMKHNTEKLIGCYVDADVCGKKSLMMES